MSEDVHLESVRPGLAPGGLWARLCTEHTLITEHALLLDGSLEQTAEADGELAGHAAALGCTAWLFIYDGDSGECVMTSIVRPGE